MSKTEKVINNNGNISFRDTDVNTQDQQKNMKATGFAVLYKDMLVQCLRVVLPTFREFCVSNDNFTGYP